MKAARIQNQRQYSASNPAPSTAIQLQEVPKPSVSKPGEVVVEVKATTVIRDNLLWPELYSENDPSRLGNDFAGHVTEIHGTEEEFSLGQAVYGMTHASRGGTWAEYALVSSEELYPKPDSLTWEEAAALPLSAMTAEQALFKHAQLPLAAQQPQRVLVTGAAGGVGVLVVAFAAAAGYHVVAATSSNARNEAFLKSRGANECIEYGGISMQDRFIAIIDTVGGDILRTCWDAIDSHGSLVSIDSASWNFVDEHRNNGFSKGKEGVKATWFVVEPSRDSMRHISDAVSQKGIKALVAKTLPLEQAQNAYDLSFSRDVGRGKVVLLV